MTAPSLLFLEDLAVELPALCSEVLGVILHAVCGLYEHIEEDTLTGRNSIQKPQAQNPGSPRPSAMPLEQAKVFRYMIDIHWGRGRGGRTNSKISLRPLGPISETPNEASAMARSRCLMSRPTSMRFALLHDASTLRRRAGFWVWRAPNTKPDFRPLRFAPPSRPDCGLEKAGVVVGHAGQLCLLRQ